MQPSVRQHCQLGYWCECNHLYVNIASWVTDVNVPTYVFIASRVPGVSVHTCLLPVGFPVSMYISAYCQLGYWCECTNVFIVS